MSDKTNRFPRYEASLESLATTMVAQDPLAELRTAVADLKKKIADLRDQAIVAKHKVDLRIEALDRQWKNYVAYQQDRVNERDHHGAWDVAIHLSEVECEIAGLKFALEAMA